MQNTKKNWKLLSRVFGRWSRKLSLKNKAIKTWRILKRFLGGLVHVSPGLLMILAIETIPLFTPKNISCFLDKDCDPAFPVEKGMFFLGSLFLTSCIVLHECLEEADKPIISPIDNLNKILWGTELRAFADNIQLTANDRITFYMRYSGSFIKVGRESKNPTFKASGRRIYKSGVIERAFNENEHWQLIQTDPAVDYEGYVTEVATQSNMSKSDVKKLKMKSRRLFAKKVTKLNGEPFGVLLIETIKTDFSHISSPCGTVMDDNRLGRIFERECRRLSHYLGEFEIPKKLFGFEEEQI